MIKGFILLGLGSFLVGLFLFYRKKTDRKTWSRGATLTIDFTYKLGDQTC